MKKVIVVIFLIVVVIFIVYVKNHYSNKTIVSTVSRDFFKYKDGLDKLINTCEILVLENDANEVSLDYRIGRDSITAIYKDNSVLLKTISKKVPKELVSSGMVLGSGSFGVGYKKNDYLTIYIGMSNYTFQKSWLIYCYDQDGFLKSHYSSLNKVYEINKIKNGAGLVYILNKNWMIVVKDI